MSTAVLRSRLPRVGWLIILAGLAVLMIPPASAQTLSAEEIMRRNYLASRVRDSQSHATITLINETGQQRIRRLFSVTRLKEDGMTQMRMARFLHPPDVKGTATLMIEHAEGDDDMWMYVPAMGKVRRLVSKNKSDGYVGTDFTYGDIIGHKVEDYSHRLVGSDTIDGVECFVVESVPVSAKVRRDSGYSKRVSWVCKDDFVSQRMEGYDLQGRLLKRLTATDIRLVDPALGRWQPMRLQMNNLQTGHRTILSYEDFKANVGVPQAFFTTRYLEKQL